MLLGFLLLAFLYKTLNRSAFWGFRGMKSMRDLGRERWGSGCWRTLGSKARGGLGLGLQGFRFRALEALRVSGLRASGRKALMASVVEDQGLGLETV